MLNVARDILRVTLPTLVVSFLLLELFFRWAIPASDPPMGWFDDESLIYRFDVSRERGMVTVGALAHQIHGAIGYTEEHALHHFTKRIWSWQDEFGTELDWNRELGRAALSSPHDTFWHFITDSAAKGAPA